MKLTKHRGYAGSIRTVWNDDRTARFGMVGTVQDFLEAGCRFVRHLVQREIQRKQQVFLSERARQEGA